MTSNPSPRQRPEPPSAGGRWGRSLAFALLAAGAAAPAFATVVAVKTSDIAAYNLALEGFQDTYRGPVVVHELQKDEVVDAALAEQIRRARPKAILAIGSKAATSLAQRIDDIPIVFSMVLDPEKRGLSGRNVTGVSLEIPPAEQLRQFKRVVPGLKRVGVVYNPAKTGRLVRDAREACARLGLSLVERTISATGEVPDAVSSLVGNVDGIWMVPDASVVTHDTFKFILVTTLEKRIPLMVFSAPFVKAGALMAVAPNYMAIGEEAAALVKAIEGGTSAGDLPMRNPPSGIVLNENTATRLGIEITAELKQNIVE